MKKSKIKGLDCDTSGGCKIDFFWGGGGGLKASSPWWGSLCVSCNLFFSLRLYL